MKVLRFGLAVLVALSACAGAPLTQGAQKEPDVSESADAAPEAKPDASTVEAAGESFYCTAWRWENNGSERVFCALTRGECETLKYYERRYLLGEGTFGACYQQEEAACARMIARGVEREVCSGDIRHCQITTTAHQRRDYTMLIPCRRLTYGEAKREAGRQASSVP